MMDAEDQKALDEKVNEVLNRALFGDCTATVALVAAFKRMRASERCIITARYRDGAVDGATMFAFVEATEETMENLVKEAS